MFVSMKNVSVLFAIVCSILMASCSSNSPSGVVKKAFDALIDEDYDTYARCLYVEDNSDSERVEKDIQDLVEIMKRNSENESEDDKISSYEILDEKSSKTGKWVCISYKLIHNNGEERESKFYVTKDDNGEWKIQMFGTDRLMDE